MDQLGPRSPSSGCEKLSSCFACALNDTEMWNLSKEGQPWENTPLGIQQCSLQLISLAAGDHAHVQNRQSQDLGTMGDNSEKVVSGDCHICNITVKAS